MVINIHRHNLFGLFLTDDIFIQLFLNLMGRRNILDRKFFLFLLLFFLLDLGHGRRFLFRSSQNKRGT